MCTVPATTLNPCSSEIVFILKSQSLYIKMQIKPEKVNKV